MNPSSPAPSSQPEPPAQSARVVCFGVFEVDLQTAELRKQGVRIRLPSQSFQVLEALLLRPGVLVTREELKQKLWPSDTFGDFEHGLSAAVNRVRDALGDSSDNPRFVETLPRRGYRFIAPVEKETEAKSQPEAVASPNGEAPSTADTSSQPSPRPKSRWIPAIAFLLLLIAVGAFLYMRLRNWPSPSSRAEDQENLRVTPLTTLPGQEASPSFSPDGSQVAFAWDGGNSNTPKSFNLYVKAIGSEKADQLTHDPGEWIIPAWSPDGSTIAFAREGGEKEGIFSVPARGGAERKLADASFEYPGFMSLSWSSDGRQLVYYADGGLRLLTPATAEVHAVDTPGCRADTPSFSPDGKWIAFHCGTDDGSYVDLLSLKGERTTRLGRGCDPLAWSVDSQRVLFNGVGLELSEISINGGEPQRLMFAQGGYQPAVASHADRLAFVKGQGLLGIWRTDVTTGRVPSVFAPASVQQKAPDISPDGKRIAFESERSGFHEVWMANLDGSDAIQLSNFRQVSLTGSPRWSPDGRRIVFDSRVSGKAALYLVDPATALPKQIPTDNIPADVPTWSADGKWVYFTSESSEPAKQGFIYKVAPEGGIPEKVTQSRGYNVQRSRDGRFLYFFTGAINSEIHVLDLASGREQPLPGMPRLAYPTDWAPGSKGIFFIDWSQPSSIDFYDFASHRVTRKIPLDRQPAMWGGLSLSPDETWLAYPQIDQAESDLMLVEGFR
jgi:Tol biopolymer transport system component/DNA-binding winged helix-turn-helix (wHTH) protein